jgi:hypothetical protein
MEVLEVRFQWPGDVVVERLHDLFRHLLRHAQGRAHGGDDIGPRNLGQQIADELGGLLVCRHTADCRLVEPDPQP